MPFCDGPHCVGCEPNGCRNGSVLDLGEEGSCGGGLAGKGQRQEMMCSVVESHLGIGVAEMFADPDLGLMLTQELSPNRVAIFGHDTYQSIDILRMLPDQFR